MRFLHAADIHLDSPLHGLTRYEGAPVEAVRGATRRAFDRLIDLAIEEEVAFVLLAGDLYDGDWRDYNTGLYFVQRMARLRDAGIPVLLVAGNHDAASQITRRLRLPDNVTAFPVDAPGRMVLEAFDVVVHGQGFAARAVTRDLSAAYPPADPGLFNIGLLHTSLEGSSGHDPYAPCSLDGLRSHGYHYWALGHIHQRTVLSEAPWILFSGNIQGRHIRESGPRGCTLVTVEGGEVTAVEARALDVLRWLPCDLDLEGCQRIDDLFPRVEEALLEGVEAAEGRPLAVRLRLQGGTPLHTRLLAEQGWWEQEVRAVANGIGGAGVWMEQVRVETRSDAQRERQTGSGALEELLQGINTLELDEGALEALAGEVEPLCQKLPPELRFGAGGYNPAAPDRLAATLEAVKALLEARLLASERDR